MKKILLLASLAITSLLAFTSCTAEETDAFIDGFYQGYYGTYENHEDGNCRELNYDSEYVVEESYSE